MRTPNPELAPENARTLWDTTQPSSGAERVVTARCTLMTPMFGGGVKPGEVDREMPIRASALRGQLRFWWRLLTGAGKEPADLFIVESALWGGISSEGPRASQVTLQVKCDPVNDQELIPARNKVAGIPTYALILETEENPELLKPGYSFELILRFRQKVTHRQQEGVFEALRWWASFAGVGARTRRGFGAVKVVSDDIEVTPMTDEEVKARGGWMVAGRPEGDPIEAWKNAVGALQRFRQGKNVGRNPGQGNRPGRSRWPEADTIRHATNTHATMHEPEHEVEYSFPRAAFGLPIVFHFKDRGDPRDQVLNPDGRDRMASPLILRPRFDGRRYRPTALLLPGWKEHLSVRVGLNSSKTGLWTPAWPEAPDERRHLAERIKPMRDQGADDVLSAFMHFFKGRPRGGR